MHKKCYKHHKEILSIEMKVEEWKNKQDQRFKRHEEEIAILKQNIDIKQQLHEIHMKVVKEVTKDLQKQLETMIQESQARNHITQQQVDDLMHEYSNKT